MLFVESPESVEEMRRIGEAFNGVPLLANMVEGGRTPVLDQQDLEALGYKHRHLPGARLSRRRGGDGTRLPGPRGTGAEGTGPGGAGQGLEASVPLYDFKQFSALMGFDRVAEFDRRYGA